MKNLAPKHKPTGVLIAYLIVVVVLIVNVTVLHHRQRDLADVVAQNRVNASTAKAAAYHNCIVTRALVKWAKELGPLENRVTDTNGYHAARFRAFEQLHDTLQRDDGKECVKP